MTSPEEKEFNLTQQHQNLNEAILACYSSRIRLQKYAKGAEWRPSSEAFKLYSRNKKAEKRKGKKERKGRDNDVEIESPQLREGRVEKANTEEAYEPSILSKMTKTTSKYWGIIRP